MTVWARTKTGKIKRGGVELSEKWAEFDGRDLAGLGVHPNVEIADEKPRSNRGRTGPDRIGAISGRPEPSARSERGPENQEATKEEE